MTSSPTTTSDDAGLTPDASAPEGARLRRVDPAKRVDTERRYIPTKAVTERRVPLATAPAAGVTATGDAGAP